MGITGHQKNREQLLSIEEEGFELHPKFLNTESITRIIADIEGLDSSHSKHGIRNAEKKLSSIKELVHSKRLLQKARLYLTGTPKIVRVIVFDKTPSKNWLVAWHQDRTISVDSKVSINNWGPWTQKDGIHHVQPDQYVLENMVTFRIHLDNANEDNGCLKVIPKSHQLGILNQSQLTHIVEKSNQVTCTANPGDLFIMRPLLLHSSSKGEKPSHRRIVHIEYSSYDLPKGLSWA